jgi:tubulin polyglutamylase TTLL6/13
MTQPPVKKGKPAASRSAEDIWADIDAIVIKTIITVQPHLSHIYKSCQGKEPDCCFELLGFDIMLDQKLKPWMLEVNHTPSFNSDTNTDHVVKDKLIKDCLEIIQLSID